MDKQKNTIYFVDQKYLGRIGDYLQENSSTYCFSAKKSEKNKVVFLDNKERIFAMIDTNEGKIELADYADLKIIRSIESIAKLGVKN